MPHFFRPCRATWSPVITVAEHDSNGGYGDPALVVERNSGDILCIATHGEGLWTATPGKSARIVVMRSSDKGNTWSAPLDITDDILTSIPENDAPIKGVTGFCHIRPGSADIRWTSYVCPCGSRQSYSWAMVSP